MNFNQAILIDNVVVSTNLQGVVRSTPIKILEKQGYDYSHVPHRSYGPRLVNLAMITSILQGEISFDDALVLGFEN